MYQKLDENQRIIDIKVTGRKVTGIDYSDYHRYYYFVS
jgi:hypothetical protein